MARWASAVLAVILIGNAAAMLALPLSWYDAVPGVPQTGPFNSHFVRDIGAAYLTAGLGCAWFAWRAREGWRALAAGALFLTLHAAIHLFDAACGTSPIRDLLRDFLGVHLLAAAALALALTARPETFDAEADPRAPARRV